MLINKRGAKQQIYALIHQFAEAGLSVVVISSEMPEVIGLSDRVLVMRRGEIAGELAGADKTEDAILRLAMGVGASAGPFTHEEARA